MIKVCMIVHKNYSLDPRVRRYAEVLSDSGNKVDVICAKNGNRKFYRKKKDIRVFEIPIRHGSYNTQWGLLIEYILASLLYTIWLIVLFIKYRYQIIHIHNMPDFLIFAAFLPRLFGAKLILDIHDPMPEVYMSKSNIDGTSIFLFPFHFQEKISAFLAHEVITANSHFESNIMKRGIPPEKITVIANMPDLNIFNREKYKERYDVKRNKFSLIYPGTIAPRYGLEVPIRALPLLKEEIPSIHLFIVGMKTNHAIELEDLAQQLNVISHVTFKPFIPAEELARLISQSDIGIYTALSDPHMDIATPTKVLEYAAMGIPIIASRLKVLEELFSNSEIIFFTPGDSEQFANCVLELYKNTSLREELVNNMEKKFLRTNTWREEQSKYINLIQGLFIS